MNNSVNDQDKKNTAQDVAQDSTEQQLVWERLQAEALAAQRWRLEQEMEEARSQTAEEESLKQQGWRGWVQNPINVTVAALASFVAVSIVALICCS